MQTCHDCDAKPGELHKPGCDVERCPYCGNQLISCGCLGDKERATWIKGNLLPWIGIWPGVEEATELGLWCRWDANASFEADKERFGLETALRRLGMAPPGRWVACDKDDPEAKPDLNRLVEIAVWDREKKRFVKRDLHQSEQR